MIPICNLLLTVKIVLIDYDTLSYPLSTFYEDLVNFAFP